MHTSVQAAPGGEGEVLGAASTAPAVTTLAKLAADYCAAYTGRDRTRPATLRWWVNLYGERPFASLTDDDVFHGLDRLRNEPVRVYAGRDADDKPIYRKKSRTRSKATCNRYHAALMALLTWAVKRRRAPKGWENPARKVERTREQNARVRFLSAEELERLLAACRQSAWPRLYVLVLMAIATGARRGELVSLTWGDVDLERGLARVSITKNGEPRVLRLVPQVQEELRRFVCDRADVRVFPARGAKGLFQPRYFEASWQAALKSAGVRQFVFHDLRHTHASYLAQRGRSLLEIADSMGHRQLAMVRRYAHLTVATKAKMVDEVFGGIK